LGEQVLSERNETRRDLNESSKDLSFFHTVEANKVINSPHTSHRHAKYSVKLAQPVAEESKMVLNLTEGVAIGD